MSRRYDSRTTIFSPEGRLHQVRARARRAPLISPPASAAAHPRPPCAQVEYAIEAELVPQPEPVRKESAK